MQRFLFASLHQSTNRGIVNPPELRNLLQRISPLDRRLSGDPGSIVNLGGQQTFQRRAMSETLGARDFFQAIFSNNRD
jgi:hypothetical protein